MSTSRSDMRRETRMKGQAATEFMVLFGMILILLLVIAYNTQRTVINIGSEKTSAKIDDTADTIMTMLDMVYLQGSGFSANITIPEDIEGLEYEISASDGFLLLNFTGDLKGRRLMAENISGTLSKGKNLVSNVDGVLVIS